MKKRDIFLDFTSLLDVTLIIIFFFVLFSHLESEENKALTEEKTAQLQEQIEIAEAREEEASELISQLTQQIEIVKDSDERQAENMEAMLEFVTGKNLKLVLDLGETERVIRVDKDNKVIAEININGDVTTELLKAMELAGYTKEDTIFCDIVYDGLSNGSNKAYKTIMAALDDVKSTYPNMYYSVTNISNGKGN